MLAPFFILRTVKVKIGGAQTPGAPDCPCHPNEAYCRMARDQAYGSGHHTAIRKTRTAVGVNSSVRLLLSCDTSRRAGCGRRPPRMIKEALKEGLPDMIAEDIPQKAKLAVSESYSEQGQANCCI